MGANGCCPCWRAGTISRSAASAEQRGPIVSSREVIPIQTSLARQILARYTCDSQEIRLGGDIDMPQSAATRWVLLIHQIPPKPDYFRVKVGRRLRSEEHTSELQSRFDLVCRLLLEKKKLKQTP